MRASIRERVAGKNLPDSVPPRYRGEVMKAAKRDGVYTLILCGHNQRDVIMSAPLVRAFKRLESVAPDGIILVGSVFTEEAKAIAQEHGARIVSLHQSKWTDESARLRQL